MTTTSQTTIEQRRELVLASSARDTYLAAHALPEPHRVPAYLPLGSYVGVCSTEASVALLAAELPSDLLAADAALHATAPAYA